MAFGLSKWDATVDVVVVGSGIGGLAAAIVAHDAGAKVARPREGAEARRRLGVLGRRGVRPRQPRQERAGIADSREEGLRYLQFLAGGYAEPELQRTLLDTGRVAARYFEEKAGVRWKIIKGFPDYHYPHAPGTVAAGRYLETELFDGATLGDWQKRTYLSPAHAQRHHARRALRLGRLRQRDEVGLRR